MAIIISFSKEKRRAGHLPRRLPCAASLSMQGRILSTASVAPNRSAPIDLSGAENTDDFRLLVHGVEVPHERLDTAVDVESVRHLAIHLCGLVARKKTEFDRGAIEPVG